MFVLDRAGRNDIVKYGAVPRECRPLWTYNRRTSLGDLETSGGKTTANRHHPLSVQGDTARKLAGRTAIFDSYFDNCADGEIRDRRSRHIARQVDKLALRGCHRAATAAQYISTFCEREVAISVDDDASTVTRAGNDEAASARESDGCPVGRIEAKAGTGKDSNGTGGAVRAGELDAEAYGVGASLAIFFVALSALLRGFGRVARSPFLDSHS